MFVIIGLPFRASSLCLHTHACQWSREKKIKIIYLMSGAPDNGRKHGPGSIVSGEAGFAHAGPVVDDKSSNVFVTHAES